MELKPSLGRVPKRVKERPENMNRIGFIFYVILGWSLMGQVSWATKAYITDSMEIDLRTGPSIESRSIAEISTGQDVEVLDRRNEWSYVRVFEGGESKKEGWVLSRYLVDRLPWALQAKSLKEENRWLKKKLPVIEEKLSETTRREQEFREELRNSAEEFQKVRQEYEALKEGAAEYSRLKATNDATRTNLGTIESDLQRLSQENELLQSAEKSKWFALGALVVLCGLMIGIVVGRQQRKRRSLYF